MDFRLKIFPIDIVVFLFSVQASIPANTFVVSGSTEHKRIEELLPAILSQCGPESMEYLRKFAETLKGAAGMGNGMEAVREGEEGEEEEDDQVPDLVENFEEAAAK